MSEKKVRPPSRGYLHIFFKVCVEGRTAEEVAKEQGIKVESVRDVVWKVRSFMRKHGAEPVMEHPSMHPAAMVREVYLARLEAQWRELLQAWRDSKQEQGVRKVNHVVRSDGKEEKRTEIVQKTQTGGHPYLTQARQLLRELIKLVGQPQPNEQGAEYVRRLTLEQREKEVDCWLLEFGDGGATPPHAPTDLQPTDLPRAA